MSRVVLRVGGTAVIAWASALGLSYKVCEPDRHGPAGTPSKAERWLHAEWKHIAGITVWVKTVEILINSILSVQNSFAVTTEGGFKLQQMLQAKRTEGTPLIVAANHVTFLDAPLLSPLIGRAASRTGGGDSFLWTLDQACWPWSVGSASLLFAHNLPATIVSMLCALPIQPKWAEREKLMPEDSRFDLNQSQYLPDLVTLLRDEKRNLVLFPEGRLCQHSLEPRDEEGRMWQLDGRKSEPHAQVGPFFSGVGRLVAHSGAQVLPVGMLGLENILRAKNDEYKAEECTFTVFANADVRVHLGKPLDFSAHIAAFHRDHPELSRLDARDALQAPDAFCQEKCALYRQITEEVRTAVLDCYNAGLVTER